MQKKIFVLTGEPSGDKLASKVVSKLMNLRHDIEYLSVGGDHLKALGIKAGDEVITAANTFVATVGAICELNAIPVLVDCNDTFCMDVDLIEDKISPEPKFAINDRPYNSGGWLHLYNRKHL